MPHSELGQQHVSPTGNPRKAPPVASRTINVEVPEQVYWHIRRCATQSRLSMKDFMAKFCREARPYPPEAMTPRASGKK